MKLDRIEPEAGRPIRPRSAPPLDYLGGAMGALVLAMIATAVAAVGPRVPAALIGNPFALALSGLFLAALCASIAKAFVQWDLDQAPLADAPWVVRSRTRFEVWWIAATLGLGLIALLGSSFEIAGTDLAWRAWLVLLIGGLVIGLTGSLVANTLFLMASSRR